jgi:MFS family permease
MADAPPSPPSPTLNASASPLLALRHPHFRLIWFAAFGSYLGNWFEFVAVRWLVTDEAKALEAAGTPIRAEDWMAYLSIAQLGPTLFLGLFGGLVADSVNRRSLLIATQLAMMVIALAMAAAAFTGHANRWTLLVLVLAQGVVVPFNNPAWQVLTPRLVPKDELHLAITLNGISFNIARTVGPAIAGLIMALFKSPAVAAAVPTGILLVASGDATATVHAFEGTSRGAAALLLFNALTFIGVMLAVLKTPDAPAPPELAGAWRHPGVAFARSKEALAWVWSRKGPRAVVAAIVVFAVLATPVMPLMSVLVHDVHSGREDTFGVFVAVMGLGAVTGGLAMKYVPPWYPMHHFIPLSCTLGGVFILLFGLADDTAWSLFTLFFVGVFWMWGFNSTAVALQKLAPDDMRGRISSVVNMIAMGLMPLGPIVASATGHAAERLLVSSSLLHKTPGLSTQLGLAICAAILIVASLVMLIWRTPEVDNIDPSDPTYDRRPGLLRGIFAPNHRPKPNSRTTGFEDAAK